MYIGKLLNASPIWKSVITDSQWHTYILHITCKGKKSIAIATNFNMHNMNGTVNETKQNTQRE